MKGMLGDFAGGLVIVIIAAVIGIAQNSVRSNPVKLIQNTRPVSTASHDAGETASSVTPEVDAAHPADGQTTPAVAEESLPEGAVSLERARQLYDQGVSIFIDARSPESFAEGHIPGAVNIPYDQLPKYLDTLQSQVLTSDHIICYCWSPTCDFSDQLATELKIMGYDNVEVFTGGWDQWIEAGHPTEEGE